MNKATDLPASGGSAEAETDAKYEIVVRSPLHEKVTHIQKSVIDLVFTTGTITDSTVLVPILEWHLLEATSPESEGDDAATSTPISKLVYFENVALLMQSMSEDLYQAIYMLAGQARGGIPPLADRMKLTAELFKSASDLLADAAQVIDTAILPEAIRPKV